MKDDTFKANLSSNKTGKAPMISALEQRILLDAAGALTGAEILEGDDHDQAASIAEADALAPQARERREVAFVDGGLEDVDTLIADLPESAEVVVIDPAQDGFAAMAAYLDGQSGVDAVHVFGHGAAGQATLGTATLDADTLDAHADALRGIGDALTEAGDILLYGCYVGAGPEGEALVEDIATLTAADVAASDDLTGAAALGGDWELEVFQGEVSETLMINLQNYGSVFAVPAAGFYDGPTTDDPFLGSDPVLTVSEIEALTQLVLLTTFSQNPGADAYYRASGVPGGNRDETSGLDPNSEPRPYEFVSAGGAPFNISSTNLNTYVPNSQNPDDNVTNGIVRLDLKPQGLIDAGEGFLTIALVYNIVDNSNFDERVFQFQIKPDNNAPVAASSLSRTASEGSTLFNIEIATDPDSATDKDISSVSFNSQPAYGTVTVTQDSGQSAKVKYQADTAEFRKGIFSDTIQFTVTDDRNASTNFSYTFKTDFDDDDVEIVDSTDTNTLSVIEGETTPVNLFVKAKDPDTSVAGSSADTISSWSYSEPNGTLTGADPAAGSNSSTTNFTYLPDVDFSGTETIEVTATGSDGSDVTETLEFTVEALNDQPFLAAVTDDNGTPNDPADDVIEAIDSFTGTPPVTQTIVLDEDNSTTVVEIFDTDPTTQDVLGGVAHIDPDTANDNDQGTENAIAITGIDIVGPGGDPNKGGGTLQYRAQNSGASENAGEDWKSIADWDTLSDSKALLLGETAELRFLSDGIRGVERVDVTYRAWDGFDDGHGGTAAPFDPTDNATPLQYADLTDTGPRDGNGDFLDSGTYTDIASRKAFNDGADESAFSDNKAILRFVVEDINDAPKIENESPEPFTNTYANGETVPRLLLGDGVTVKDIDNPNIDTLDDAAYATAGEEIYDGYILRVVREPASLDDRASAPDPSFGTDRFSFSDAAVTVGGTDYLVSTSNGDLFVEEDGVQNSQTKVGELDPAFLDTSGTVSEGKLKITFNGDATDARVEAVLARLQFSMTQVPTGDMPFRIKFTDTAIENFVDETVTTAPNANDPAEASELITMVSPHIHVTQETDHLTSPGSGDNSGIDSGSGAATEISLREAVTIAGEQDNGETIHIGNTNLVDNDATVDKVEIEDDLTVPESVTLQLDADVTFEVAAGKELTINAKITGPGTITKTGDGVLILNNAANDFGPAAPATVGDPVLTTHVVGGTLRSHSDAMQGDRTDQVVTVDSGATFQLVQGANSLGVVVPANTDPANWSAPGVGIFKGSITGQGDFDKAGDAWLRLHGDELSPFFNASDFSGATTVREGELAVTGQSIGDESAVTVHGGATLTVAEAENIGSLASEASTLTAPATVNIDPVTNPEVNVSLTVGGTTNSWDTTFEGYISGDGTLVKAGHASSSLTLDSFDEDDDGVFNSASGNTFSGGLEVVAGTIRLRGGQSVADDTSVSIGASGQLVLEDSETVGPLEGSGIANLDSGQTLVIQVDDADDDSTVPEFTGQIVGAGNLEKIGAGQQILNNTAPSASNYTGTTVISGGTLVATGRSIGDESAVTLSGGATLEITGDEEIGSLATSDSGSTVVVDANKYLTLGGDDTTTSFEGLLSGDGGLRKIGAGAFTIDRSTGDSGGVNTFASALVVADGEVILSGGAAVADTTSVELEKPSSGKDVLLTVDTSETIDTLSSNAPGSAGNTTTVKIRDGETLTLADTADATYYGQITGRGSLAKTGSGTFTLDNFGTDAVARAEEQDLVVELFSAVDFTSGSDADALDSGDQITYTLRVRNTSGQDKEIGSLSGGFTDGSGIVDFETSSVTLQAYESRTFTATYTTTADDIDTNDSNGNEEADGSLKLAVTLSDTAPDIDSDITVTDIVTEESRYTGTTVISGGTLVATGRSIGDESAVTLSGGATLRTLGTEAIGSLSSENSAVGSEAVVQVEPPNDDPNTASDTALIVGGDNTNTVFKGAISGEGGFTKEGNGELTLDTTGLEPGNTFSGPLSINDGAVTVTGGNSIDDNTAVIVNDDGENDADGGGKLNVNDSEEVGSLSGNGDANIGGDSKTRDGLRMRLEADLETRLDDLMREDDTITYTLTLENITGSSISVDGVTANLSGLGAVKLDGSDYTLGDGLTIAASATATITGVYTIASDDLDGNAETGNEGALNAISNVFTVQPNGADAVDLSETTPLTPGEPADTLTVSGTDPVEDPIPPFNGDTSGPGGLVVEGPGGFDNGGTLGHDGGTVINGGGTLDNSGTISGDGDIDVDDGTFTNSGDVTGGDSGQGGDVNVGEEGELENEDGGTIAGDVTNDGGEVTNEEGGTIEGDVTNDGGTVDNDGTIKGNVENDDGDFDNDGTIEGDVTNRGEDGDFDNGKGGVVEGDVDNEDGDVNNDGEIKGDVTTDGGGVTNGGNVQGGVTVDGGGTFDNTGTIGGTRVQDQGLDVLLTSELNFANGDVDAVDAGDEINYSLTIENTTGSDIAIDNITTEIAGVDVPVTFPVPLTVGAYASEVLSGTYTLTAADTNGDPNDGNAGSDEDIDLDVRLAGGDLVDDIVLSDQTRLNTEETNVEVKDGEFNNEGTVNGDVTYTPPQGSYSGDGEVTGTVGPEELVVTLDGMVDISNGVDADRVDADDVITYRLSVTNNSVDGRAFDSVNILEGLDNASGDIDLAAIVTEGVNLGDINADGKLDKGETWVYEGNLTLSGDDFDGDETTGRENAAGDIEQTVEIEVAGTDETLTRAAVESTRLVAVPKMNVSTRGRLVDVNDDGVVNAGDRIDYTTELTNTGNVFLSGLTVSDSIATFSQTEDDGNGNQVPVPSSDADDDGKIRVGEAWSFQSSYTLTETDITSNAGGNGLIENTVVASAAELDTPEFATGEVTLEIPPAEENRSTFNPSGKAPSLKASLFGTIDPAVIGDSEAIEAGDTITYRLVLENTGDNGLTGIALEENLFNAGSDIDFDLSNKTGDVGVAEVIDPGETWVIDGATLTLTEDALAGNGLNVVGNPDNDGDIDQKVVVSSVSLDADVVASVATRLMVEPELDVSVDSQFKDGSGNERLSASDGDELVYTVTVRNSGNTAVTGIAASSGLALTGGGLTTTTTPTELDSGETLVFTGTYDDVALALSGNGLDADGLADDDGDIDNTITVTSDNAATVIASDEIDLIYSERGASAGGAENAANASVELRLGGSLDTESPTSASNGDAIDYLLTVENTGNRELTNLGLSSDIDLEGGGWALLDAADGFGDVDADGILDLDETWAFSARHIITGGADVTNNVSLTSPNLPDVETVSETTNFRVTRDLSVTSSHRILDADGNERANAAAGDRVAYTIVVENSGNDPLTNVVVEDPLLGGELSLQRGDLVNTGELDAGERWVYTGSVEVTAEILGSDARPNGGLDADGALDNDGDIDNTVTVTSSELSAVTASGVAVLQNADPAAGETDGPDAVVDPAIGDGNNTNGDSNAQGLQVRLYGTLNPLGKVDGTDALEAGDTIDYWLALENTSDAEISIDSIARDSGSNVVLQGNGFGGTQVTLAAGESVILTASYVLGDSDVGADKGDVSKTLIVDVTGDTDTVQVTDTTAVNRAVDGDDDQPVLTRAVTVNKSGLIKDSAGNVRAIASGDDQIDYTITVQNTGNVALNNVIATDSLISLERVTGAEGGDVVNAGVLDVGEIWVYTGSLDDLSTALAGNGLDLNGVADNDGDIDNAVTVTADDLSVPGFARQETVLSVQADADDPGRVPDERVSTNADGLSVSFNGYWTVTDAAQSQAKDGDTIEYRLVIANNSDQTYAGWTVQEDVLPGDSGANLSIFAPNKLGGDTDADLEAGETWIYTGSYVLSQGDLDANGVAADGTADDDGDIDQRVRLTADGGVTVIATESTTLALNRKLTAELEGTWTDASPTAKVAAAGDTVSYVLTLENTGNVELTGVSVVASENVHTGDSGSGLDTGARTLVTGETQILTGSYVLSQGDLDANGVDAEGIPDGDGDIDQAVTIESDNLGDDVIVTEATRLALTRSLEVTKTARILDSEGSLRVNTQSVAAGAEDKIEYLITATNTGNVAISGVSVEDPLLGGNLGLPDNATDSLSDSKLSAGETWTWTPDRYVITQDDLDGSEAGNAGSDGDIDNTVTVLSNELANQQASVETVLVPEPIGETGAEEETTETAISTVGGLVLEPDAIANFDIAADTLGNYDQFLVTEGGEVNLNGAELRVNLIESALGGGEPYIPGYGETFTVIDNNTGNPIEGRFTYVESNDAARHTNGTDNDVVLNTAGDERREVQEGDILRFDGYDFRVSYSGGAGDDVVLTRVNMYPEILADAGDRYEDADGNRLHSYPTDADGKPIIADKALAETDRRGNAGDRARTSDELSGAYGDDLFSSGDLAIPSRAVHSDFEVIVEQGEINTGRESTESEDDNAFSVGGTLGLYDPDINEYAGGTQSFSLIGAGSFSDSAELGAGDVESGDAIRINVEHYRSFEDANADVNELVDDPRQPTLAQLSELFSAQISGTAAEQGATTAILNWEFNASDDRAAWFDYLDKDEVMDITYTVAIADSATEGRDPETGSPTGAEGNLTDDNATEHAITVRIVGANDPVKVMLNPDGTEPNVDHLWQFGRDYLDNDEGRELNVYSISLEGREHATPTSDADLIYDVSRLFVDRDVTEDLDNEIDVGQAGLKENIFFTITSTKPSTGAVLTGPTPEDMFETGEDGKPLWGQLKAEYKGGTEQGMLPGLQLDMDTGVISGRPIDVGTYVIDVTAIDSDGAVATRSFELLIVAPPDAMVPAPSPEPRIDARPAEDFGLPGLDRDPLPPGTFTPIALSSDAAEATAGLSRGEAEFAVEPSWQQWPSTKQADFLVFVRANGDVVVEAGAEEAKRDVSRLFEVEILRDDLYIEINDGLLAGLSDIQVLDGETGRAVENVLVDPANGVITLTGVSERDLEDLTLSIIYADGREEVLRIQLDAEAYELRSATRSDHGGLRMSGTFREAARTEVAAMRATSSQYNAMIAGL